MAEPAEHSEAERREDRQALEAFVVENADLEMLEGLLEQFNIFEAIGVLRQELRHSDLLAFLLDPKQNHRLGDAFVRSLLRQVLTASTKLAPAVSSSELDSRDLGRLAASREWQSIDILLVDQINSLVVVIENKIDSTEHSGQLKRYLDQVRAEYPAPKWRHLAIYLTPEGDIPSLIDYLPADYGLVADVVEAVAENSRAVLDPAVHALMVHYARMIRRHIVADSEIAELCRRIYHRHQRALDLIFEHRPDRLAEVQAILLELVGSWEDLILDTAAKQLVRFGHKDWEKLPKGMGWTPSGRMVLFTLDSYAERLDLGLWVGPGPAEARQRLIELALARQPPYSVVEKGTGTNQRFTKIFSRHLLTPEDYQDATLGEIEARIRTQWLAFVDHDLPALVPPIQEASSSIATPIADGEASGVPTAVLVNDTVEDR